MKRIYSTLLILGILTVMLLFSSCAPTPSDEIIQTATAKTELVSTVKSIALPTLAATSTVDITLTPTQDTKRQKLISEVVALFEIGSNDAYLEAYDKLNFDSGPDGKYWNDEEIQALRYFAAGMVLSTEGIDQSNFSTISPNYSGVYHEQMSSKILKYITRDEWIRRYEEMKPVHATVVAKLSRPLPAIGMTTQQVLDSRWGKPTDINKTTTAVIVYEQWVYDGGKYIYLENGIVVAIQE